jgi:DNA-binding NtrC family response regulator
MACEWKGNVRELKNVLESAIVMSRDDVLQPEYVPVDLLAAQALQPGISGPAPYLVAGDYREAKRQFEIAYIKAKLREYGGNITRTASAIGLHRQSLQEKLRELGIQAEKE